VAAPEIADSLPPDAGLSPARRRLYVTALRLFGEHGYHAVSVRDITDALGQRPGALYAHASSKQELLFALIRLGTAEHRDRVRGAVLEAGSDPVEQLRALVRAHVLVYCDYPELAGLTIREARALDAAQRAEVRAVVGETERTLMDVITRGQRLGEFGEVDELLIGSALGGMGAQLAGWWTPAAPRTAEQIADTYADYALRLVR
jgi:AcrR family transcriptional regulator